MVLSRLVVNNFYEINTMMLEKHLSLNCTLNPKSMKKFTTILLVLLAFSLKAQLLVPLFEPPTKVEPLSDRAEESTPITFNNGEAMFFNRFYEKIDEDGGVIRAQDIWFAENGKKGWGRPFRAFRDVDGREIKLLIGCSRDGEKLYILNRYFEGDSIHHRIIYKTRKGKATWKDPEEINIPGIDLSDQQTTVFMHSDGDVLMVSKLTEDATPNEDLFVTYKQEDGTWSDLINLGSAINTKGLEFAPFLTHDKKALYFASNGHKGFGESDIFVSYRRDGRWDRWSRPLNLGLPINSSAFESHFIISDTNQVYFTSDRESDNTDIYYTKATGEFKIANEGILAGQLYKDRQPLKAATLNVFDKDGTFIEFIKTDDEGKFKFAKLQADDNYEIKQDSIVEESLAGSILYIVDGKGKLQKRLVFNEEGSAISPENHGKTETVFGKFMEGDNPMLNTALVVLDENGFPIDTIYTNDKGEFSYEKLSMDKEIFVQPRDINEEGYDGLELYLTDEGGNRTKTFIGEEDLAGTVFGKFAYKKLPLANAAIVVLDEDGVPIDTIYTDNLGAYRYKKLNSDDEISFSILNTDDLDIEDLELTVLDEKGKQLKKLRLDKASGLFSEELQDEDALTMVEKPSEVTKDEKEAKPEVVPSTTTTTNTKMDKLVLQFDFNKTYLDASGNAKLKKALAGIKAYKGQLLISGHTDNVGSEEVNLRVAKKRALSVKRYLLAQGISDSNIKVESKGEMQPISSNETEEGRANNRRVEISFK